MKEIFLYYGYIKEVTIDANKHPNDQITDLHKLLIENKKHFDIYCNSPYVMSEITIIEGYRSYNIHHYLGEFSNKHFEVMADGSFVEGKYYKSMMSDENLLNNKLADGNDRFSDLLDIVQQSEIK